MLDKASKIITLIQFNLTISQYHLIPILFNINAPAFGEADGGAKPFRNNGQIILLVMRNKRFNNESSYRRLATSHLNLPNVQYNKKVQERKTKC